MRRSISAHAPAGATGRAPWCCAEVAMLRALSEDNAITTRTVMPTRRPIDEADRREPDQGTPGRRVAGAERSRGAQAGYSRLREAREGVGLALQGDRDDQD